MLKTVLRMKSPFHIARQEQAPLLREREVFLEHLLRQGSSLPSVRSVAWQLLNVIRLLKLTSLREVSIDEIKRASQRWARQQQVNSLAHSYKNSATLFVYVAKKWLRFLGQLKNPASPPVRFAPEIDQFAAWMKEDRGLSASTVRSHQSKVMLFLRWFSEHHRSLTNIRLTDVDEFFIWRGAKGWTRKSACDYASSLRTFFRFTVLRGWCRPGIAEGIISPTLYGDEGLPKGPEWSQVQQLLQSVRGSKPATIRARAVLQLLTFYGLRSGEICRLRLSDFDWRMETFTVTHSKRGGVQKYPLQREVGDAILAYIKKARPRSSSRNLFLTLHPPYRPIGTSALWKITSLRMQAAGIQSHRRGPHCLRHACATHLLQNGVSLKEIGDLLGHHNADSTRIYAKVNLVQLRRVAQFDLRGLL